MHTFKILCQSQFALLCTCTSRMTFSRWWIQTVSQIGQIHLCAKKDLWIDGYSDDEVKNEYDIMASQRRRNIFIFTLFVFELFFFVFFLLAKLNRGRNCAGGAYKEEGIFAFLFACLPACVGACVTLKVQELARALQHLQSHQASFTLYLIELHIFTRSM